MKWLGHGSGEKHSRCCTGEEVYPVEALKVESDKAMVDEETYVNCGTCIEECPENAISPAE
jgi:ferredoxin